MEEKMEFKKENFETDNISTEKREKGESADKIAEDLLEDKDIVEKNL